MTGAPRGWATDRTGSPVLPPSLPVYLLQLCLPGPVGSALLGDLDEEFFTTVVPRSGSSVARRWYWGQVLRSLWPALTLHVHVRSLGRFVTAVLFGVATLWVVGDLAMTATVSGLRAAWPSDSAPSYLLEAAYILGMLPVSVLGGFVAAWHGDRTGFLAALTLAAVILLPAVVITVAGGEIGLIWSHAVWFLGGPLGVVWGASRYVRRHPAH